MIATAIVGGLGIGGVILFGIWARLDSRRANRAEVSLVKAEVAQAMLESELTASRQQRKHLAEALVAARNATLALEKDLEDVATLLPVDVLDRIRADVGRLLSFGEEADEPDKLPAVAGDVPGQPGEDDLL